MKKIRIISLGEIVTPNLGNGLKALAEMVTQKKSSELQQVLPQVQSAVQKNLKAIENFKKGLLSENEFNVLFIEELRSETKIELTTEEFNSAWNTMNPKYATFKQALETALAFHTKENQQLILISYTNPKDLRHLSNELQINNIPHQLDSDGNLCEISGIKLHATYINKATKADLIKKIIVELHQSDTQHNRLFSESKDDSQPLDIKYIHGVNQIQFATLRKDFDNTTSSVQATAEKFQVDSILWNKQSTPLADTLNEENPVHGLVLASML